MFHHGVPPRLPALKAKRVPRAAPVVLQYGDTVVIGGQMFVVSPGLTPVQGVPPPTPPPPTPPPVKAAIYGFRTLGRDWVGQCHTGDTIIIDGVGLAGAKEVRFDAFLGTGVRDNATGVSVTVPAVGPQAQAVAVSVLLSDGTVLRGPTLVVAPVGAVLAPENWLIIPYVTGITDARGIPVAAAKPGQMLTIRGDNFGHGELPGSVSVRGIPAPVLSWAMDAVAITVPSLPAGSAVVRLQRMDGGWNDTARVQIAP